MVKGTMFTRNRALFHIDAGMTAEEASALEVGHDEAITFGAESVYDPDAPAAKYFYKYKWQCFPAALAQFCESIQDEAMVTLTAT